jgi:tetratricopeptide (TPR) repeat protein
MKFLDEALMQVIRCSLVSLLLLLIPQTITISGRILDREGEPLVKARVVYTNTSNGRTYSAKTEKKGEFTMAGLTEGYYQVVITDAAGTKVFSGQRNVHGVNEDQRWWHAPGEEQNVLNVDLSAAAPPGTNSATESNPSQGKLNKEQLDLVRKENANAVKINRLITDLHTQLDQQDWPHATETLQQLIALDPNRWEFYQNLGTIQSNLSHYDEAARNFAKGIEVAEKTLEHAPDPARAKADISGLMLSEGDAYNRLNKLDQAIALYNQAASLSPQPAQAYYRACNAQTNHGNTAAAIEACNQAIAADPNQWEFYQLLASAQIMAGKNPEALQTYDKGIEAAHKSLEAKPDSPRSKNGLGQMLTAKGNLFSRMEKYDEAIAAFTEAAASSVYPALPYYNLCATYYNISRMDDAVAACDKAIAGDPSMADAYYIKGATLFGKGHLESGRYVCPPQTEDVLNKYLGLAPFGPHANAVRGMLEKLDSYIDMGSRSKSAKKK